MRRLLEEIATARSWSAACGAELPTQVGSVYLGGGTPSLLLPEQMQSLFMALRDEFGVAADAEITMEAAPGQIGDALLEAALACGVNRVSLGVQSFMDREAQAVGRSHTGVSCLAELERLRAAGVGNLGVDLIAGLPYQTEASWSQSLDIAGACGLDHLSVYMLEVDEDSRLGREVLGGGARLHAPAIVAEDAVAGMYEEACRRLPGMGFLQYEISNFAQPERRSEHNQRYWERKPYLGFGLDAHSMLTALDGKTMRWANMDELEHYLRIGEKPEAQTASDREVFEEIVFLGLRLCEGLRWEALEGEPPEWVAALRGGVEAMCREGLMSTHGTRFSLTERGRLLSGSVFGELLCSVTA